MDIRETAKIMLKGSDSHTQDAEIIEKLKKVARETEKVGDNDEDK